MKKLILFDLDGVLVDAKKIHFESLNKALLKIGEEYVISESEHLSIFDGLKTYEKLQILTNIKNLDKKHYESIWNDKQNFTLNEIYKLKLDQNLINLFKFLKNNNYKVGCCSNSIKKSVVSMLSKIGIINYMDLILSNEDVKNPKPHPEIYWKAMSEFGLCPEDTLIVEDSPYGLLAAQRSGASAMRVKNPKDLTLEKIQNFLYNNPNKMNTKWQDKNLNVLIPMAGAGSRFEKAGYTFPKPLIDVNGSPMIKVVVDNLNFDSHHIFITQHEHREKYNLTSLLNLISSECDIIDVDGLTEGACCTTLLAEHLIDNDCPLLIANSDQYLDWNTSEFMYKMQEQDVDAGIVTFRSTHPKWSFAKIDANEYVTEVAEKNPISDIATAGIYYWKHGRDYVKYAKQMIAKDIRFNNEFYVCPVFNQAIADGKRVKTYDIDEMWGIGTPEDLNYFLKNKL
jgi:HAD superfamily hydrolase (TIGR01509 family)